jgi:hypothetical protein
MLFHSCIRARCSSSKVYGGFKPFRTRRPSSFHKCSMEFKSGDNAGHRMVRIWFKTFFSQMNPDFVWSLVMGGRLFTVVAENASLTLVYWKQTVLAEVASWYGVMGFKSGDNAGHGRVRIWLSFRKSIDTRATWHRTLSCWKTWLKRFILQSDHLLYKYATSLDDVFEMA